MCSCGATLELNQKFCKSCCKVVDHLPTQILYCGRCKTPVKRDECFCAECGIPVTDVSLLTTPTPCSEEPAPAGKLDIKDGTGSEAQPCKDIAAQPLESKFSNPNDSTTVKENGEKCLNAVTDGEHPSPVTSGGEQKAAAPTEEIGQSQETKIASVQTSKRSGETTGGAGGPGDSVADVSGSSESGEPDKDITGEGAEDQSTDIRHSQPTGQTDLASDDKDGANLPEKPPIPETKPDENQSTAEAPCEGTSVDSDTNKPSDSPQTPPQSTEALPEVRSTADPEQSSSNTTLFQLVVASPEMQNDVVLSHTGDPASQEGKEHTTPQIYPQNLFTPKNKSDCFLTNFFRGNRTWVRA